MFGEKESVMRLRVEGREESDVSFYMLEDGGMLHRGPCVDNPLVHRPGRVSI